MNFFNWYKSATVIGGVLFAVGRGIAAWFVYQGATETANTVQMVGDGIAGAVTIYGIRKVKAKEGVGTAEPPRITPPR